MEKSEQFILAPMRTPTQFVWMFLIGMVLTIPGVLIAFLLILKGYRLMPELAAFPSVFYGLIALFFLCCGISFMVTSARSLKQARRWETEGQIANGIIEKVWTETTNARYQHFTLYFVRYRFRVMEKDYIMQQTVSEKEFASLTQGKVIPVKYLPDKPQIARMAQKH